MRKHIIGFALFTFIVTCGVMIYGFLYTPPMPRVEEVRVPVVINEPYITPSTELAPLTYKIKSYTVDIGKVRGIAEVEFEWNSDDAAPKELDIEFGLTTPSHPFGRFCIGTSSVSIILRKSKSVTKTIGFEFDPIGGALDPQINYYGYIEVANPREKDDRSTKLVYTEKNRMIGAISVLIRHPLKK